jgi:hypothetical protein
MTSTREPALALAAGLVLAGTFVGIAGLAQPDGSFRRRRCSSSPSRRAAPARGTRTASFRRCDGRGRAAAQRARQ